MNHTTIDNIDYVVARERDKVELVSVDGLIRHVDGPVVKSYVHKPIVDLFVPFEQRNKEFLRVIRRSRETMTLDFKRRMQGRKRGPKKEPKEPKLTTAAAANISKLDPSLQKQIMDAMKALKKRSKK